MAKIVIMNWMTLDGVMQGPGRAGEDESGGFRHSGWSAPYSDPAMTETMGERMAGLSGYLFGRRTYEILLSSWNEQGGRFKDALDATPKYVVSRDAHTALAWPQSTLVAPAADHPGASADAGAIGAVAELRERVDGKLVVMGSAQLVGALLAADLVDELLLIVAPLILGSGRRLFPADADGTPTAFRLVESATYDSGAQLAVYARDGV